MAVTNLDDADAVQLALPFDRVTGGALDRALDDVRDRFGSSMVSRAALLGRDPRVVDAAPARSALVPAFVTILT